MEQSSSTAIEIYEFSTGIQVERMPDGGWRSQGFAGEYMNKTINPIPLPVQSAISNREFAVAEGASRDDPAILGREVSYNGEVWSVVAIVNKGWDDRGRTFSAYRYFLCQGEGNLWKILDWIKQQRQEQKIPVFDPFDAKVVGQAIKYQPDNDLNISLQPGLQNLLAGEAPIVIPCTQPCSPLIINQMATAKAQENGEPVAWAYLVEALEKPNRFQVVFPASQKAENLLRKAIASAPPLTATIAGEQEIKSAIKTLISRDQVKFEQLQAIENALTNPRVDTNYWEGIFNGQGAGQARTQGIYSPQMVRLMTLRAMILPETLPEFIAWVQKRGKQDDHKQVSQALQSEITPFLPEIPSQETHAKSTNQLPNLAKKVEAGVQGFISQLPSNTDLLEVGVWLLKLPNGSWSKFSESFLGAIENQSLSGQQVWQRLGIPQTYPDNEYLKIADFFYSLEKPRLSAFFYHVCGQDIPSEIFYQLRSRNSYQGSVYGSKVKRKLTPLEILCRTLVYILEILVKIGVQKMPVALVVIFVIVGFISGLFAGGFKLTSAVPPSPPPATSGPAGTETAKNKLSCDTNKTPDKMDDTLLEAAKGKFTETMKEIEDQIVQIRNDHDHLSKNDIIKALQNSLCDPNLVDYKDYKEAQRQPPIQKIQDKWIKAIYNYQKKNDLPKKDGIISPDEKTVTKLREEIEKKLKSK